MGDLREERIQDFQPPVFLAPIVQVPLANPIVPEDSIGWPGQVGFAGVALSSDLGWLLGQNAKALRNQHELGDGRNLQLVHDAAAMGLDRPLCRPKLAPDLFVHLSPSDAFKNLSFARRQAADQLLQRVELLVFLL